MSDLHLIGAGLDAILLHGLDATRADTRNAARVERYRRALEHHPAALHGLRHSFGRQMREAWRRGDFPDMRGWRDVMAQIDSAMHGLLGGRAP